MTLADFIRAFAALALTLGLVFGAFVLARRLGLTRLGSAGNATPRTLAAGPGPIRLLDRQALGPGRMLVVVRWGGADHLIGLGPAFCTLIARHDAQPGTVPGASPGTVPGSGTEPLS